MGTDQDITISCRIGFEAVHEIAPRLKRVDFPIELALPWRYAMWQAAESRFEEMAASLASTNVDVRSNRWRSGASS